MSVANSSVNSIFIVGCGKTSMVQACAAHYNIPMVKVMPSLLLKKYVGESNQMV